MLFRYDDGGRADAGYKGHADDCVVRAIAIAASLPYQKVYDDLFHLNTIANKPGEKCSPRDGNTGREVYDAYLKALGFTWVPCMKVGVGCKVHMRADELPAGRLVCRVSKHLAAVIDGVLHDTHNCTRAGTRCVYGYFIKA